MAENIQSILEKCEKIGNLNIYNSFLKTYQKLQQHDKIVCSISGGADSDIVLDIMTKLDTDKKVKYVFFDTGVELQATKNHLDYLEQKYGVVIERLKAVKPIPVCCKEYGLPFWSKRVSEMIERLQRHDFQWEDEPYEVLITKYNNCIEALKWWCNYYPTNEGFRESHFNINFIKGLKEYMVAFPPQFRISSKCCDYAKKKTVKKRLKELNADLNIYGVRVAEGGIRMQAYKSCYSEATDKDIAHYRPILWYSDKDKQVYEQQFGITHSDCYTKYGFKRTGCVGCPFAKGFEKELEQIEKKEPKMYKAANAMFGKSYEYTKEFMEFRKNLFEKNGVKYKQETLFDLGVE